MNYVGTEYELPDCELDARNMAALLEKSGVKCTVITDQCGGSFLLSHLAVTESARSKPGDTFYLYFSGHGTQVGSKEGICLYRKSKGIEVVLDKDLRVALDQIDGAKFLILDSCFSGGMDRTMVGGYERSKFIPFNADTMGLYKPAFDLRRNVKPTTQKLYCMFACQKNEVAYSTGIGGKFTNGIRKAAADGRRTIKTVMAAAEDYCYPSQTPKTVIVGGNNQKRVL